MARSTFSKQELAFLDAIHAEPRDDAIRLIYADWLEEHDNPMGAFVRWQVRNNRLLHAQVGSNTTRFAGLELQHLNGPDPASVSKWNETLRWADPWLRPFPVAARYKKPNATFRRGLPEISWGISSVNDEGELDVIAKRLPPHLRIRSFCLPVGKLRSPLAFILSRPGLKRITRLVVPLDSDRLSHFLTQFADTNLPDHISSLMLSRRTAMRDEPHMNMCEAILDFATRLLGKRMDVILGDA